MIKSMTGYGCAKGVSGGIEISIELKSVNNRYLDCNIRMPRVYASIEDTLRNTVQKHISRGKVDVFINTDSSMADDVVISVNKPLAKAYMAALNELAESYGISGDVTSIQLLKLPDVFKLEKQEADIDKLSRDMCEVLCTAIEEFNLMRLREGQRLFDDISARLNEIERLTAMAEERSPKTVSEYRARLEAKMQEVLQNSQLDENRIIMEAAIFADKVSINEETVRLKSHISQMREILKENEPVGRKLDFLIQEFNREANTIGSKGNDAEMAQIVVDLKSEIEKIREQIQNVE